jgi:hypothetical protein
VPPLVARARKHHPRFGHALEVRAWRLVAFDPAVERAQQIAIRQFEDSAMKSLRIVRSAAVVG